MVTGVSQQLPTMLLPAMVLATSTMGPSEQDVVPSMLPHYNDFRTAQVSLVAMDRSPLSAKVHGFSSIHTLRFSYSHSHAHSL